MKKLFLISLLLLFTQQAFGRAIVVTTRIFDTVRSSTSSNLNGTAISYHRIAWSFTGTVTTCQVKLKSSADNSTWADLIANQTCTSAGMSAAVTGSHNYVQLEMTTLTGGGTVAVTYEGFSPDPSAAIGLGGPAGGILDMANNLITNIGAAGTDFTSGGRLQLVVGTVALPALAIGEAGTGFWLNTSGLVEFTSNGGARVRFGPASFTPTTTDFITLGQAALGWKQIFAAFTNTPPGTTGNQTINKMSGRVNIAAAGTSVVVTNSLVAAASNVFAVACTADATANVKNVVPAAGSFTITTVAVTAETAFCWWVLNN